MLTRIGLIVNPIAGLGGTVGLKGTDGIEVVETALRLGAEPQAQVRTSQALKLAHARTAQNLKLITAAGPMGEEAACAASFSPFVVSVAIPTRTTREHTQAVIAEMLEVGIDLLVFSGGDGTARDVYDVVGQSIPCIGLPAGVKIYSGVFGRTPAAVADIIVDWVKGQRSCALGEVVDADENAIRLGRPLTKPFGHLQVPMMSTRVQSPKSPISTEAVNLQGIAQEVLARLTVKTVCILGPGTTTGAIGKQLGLRTTLLGFDLIQDGKLLASDVTERDILKATNSCPAKIVVTPIGGQGHILGRGNQQLSPAVLRQVGVQNLIVVASPQKIAGLPDHAMIVDTANPEIDRELAGHIRVITGWRRETVCPVEVS